jgi:hypothetical protein
LPKAFAYIRRLVRTIGLARRHAASLVVLACIAAALVPTVRATQGLNVPYDVDQFRDIAAAQAVADGHLLADPFYQHETIWYNPLLADVVAAMSKAGAVAVPRAHVIAGVVLNTAAVIGFFAAGAALCGEWAAVMALALMLFSRAYVAVWVTPSLSPWLFTASFAATFFYSGLLACAWAPRRPAPWRWLVVGGLLGLTFLAHTAPR